MEPMLPTACVIMSLRSVILHHVLQAYDHLKI